MLRVGAKYQYLTCCAGCCFHTAEKWDAIFSRRRSFAAADVAAAIAPPTALSKNPADAQASVNPSKLKAAVARRSRRCDRWRRSAPKSCLQGIFTKPELDCIWRPVPEDTLAKTTTPLCPKPTISR
jgi:hypothetical protein